MKLNDQQQAVIDDIKNRKSVLVTGPAGTGKSTILDHARMELAISVTASTGIAAVNVGGSTLHRFAGLGMGQQSAKLIAKSMIQKGSMALDNIRRCRRLAIDEVSMISADLFDKVSDVFKIIRKDDRPFGGVPVLMFGDFLQLPPVDRNSEAEFAFQSKAWRAMDPVLHMLTEVFRQPDPDFAQALNDVRLGKVTPLAAKILQARLRAVDEEPEKPPVKLYTHNADVRAENLAELDKIEDEEVVFTAIDSGKEWACDVLDKNCLAEKELRVKVGARVMLLTNLDPEQGLANGSSGTVARVEPPEAPFNTGSVTVEFDCGENATLELVAWEYKEDGKVLATREQIPLKLAWAVTIHKSQGMTLDKMRVNLAKVFEFGQAYVALSRCRTAEGLFIADSRKGVVRAHPVALEFYESGGEIPPSNETEIQTELI